jgi:hypothetical protein
MKGATTILVTGFIMSANGGSMARAILTAIDKVFNVHMADV